MNRTVKALLALLIGATIIGMTACGSDRPTEQATSTFGWFTTAATTTSDTTAATTTAPPVTTKAPVTAEPTTTTVPATTPVPATTTTKPVTATAKPVTTTMPVATTAKPVTTAAPVTVAPQEACDYVLNNKSMVFHTPNCGNGKNIKVENRGTFSGTCAELIAKGYSPCGNCDPADDLATVPTTTKTPVTTAEPQTECDFVLNTKSKKFHTPDCGNGKTIKDENRGEFSGTRDELIAQGYSPCGNCDP